MSQSYGTILDPYRKLKEPLGVKGNRQTVVINNNPSTIDQGQTLTIRFPNLGSNDVIVPGTARVAFQIDLSSESDENRTVVTNLGRAIVSQITVKLEGREVLSLNNADTFLIYSDLWLTKNERDDAVYQGIQSDGGLKHRVDAGDKSSNAESELLGQVYGNRFCIPLDFELLNAHLPYYQGALRDRLSYELKFNEYGSVIRSSDTETKYTISNITLEFDTINHPELARLIAAQYQSRLAIYYERILHHSTMRKNKADTIWNLNFNTPARSMKGILILFTEAATPYERSAESYYNPKITKLTCTIEGQPNQLYASGLLPYQHFDEARKLFAGGRLRNPTSDLVSKDLHLHDVRLSDYLKNKYCLWLDLRSTDDNKLHGSGRRIENASEGVTLQIEKTKEDAEDLDIHLFIISDAQLNIEENRLKDIVY